MKKVLIVLMLIQTVLLPARAIKTDGRDSLKFDVKFTKNGILDYGFGTKGDTGNAEPVVFAPSASTGSSSATFNFYYENTYRKVDGNPYELHVVFDYNDLYDYGIADSGYMLYNIEKGTGLNYEVTMTGINGTSNNYNLEINLSGNEKDSRIAMSKDHRVISILPGEYNVQLTLNIPSDSYYIPGEYKGFVLLVYQPGT